MSTTQRAMIPQAAPPPLKGWRPRPHLSRPGLPPIEDIPVPAVADAIRECVTLADRERAAVARIRGLEGQRSGAIKTDEDSDAAAVREGKPLAKVGAALLKLEEEVAAAGREADAISRAADAAQKDLVRLLTQHGDELRMRFEERIQAAGQAFTDAVEAADAAKTELDRARGLRSWAGDWSSNLGRNVSSGHTARIRPFKGGRSFPVGDGRPWASLLAELGSVVAGPERPSRYDLLGNPMHGEAEA